MASKASTPAMTLKSGTVKSESQTIRTMKNKNYKFNEIQKDQIAEESVNIKEEVMTQMTKKAPKPTKHQDDKKAAPAKIVEQKAISKVTQTEVMDSQKDAKRKQKNSPIKQGKDDIPDMKLGSIKNGKFDNNDYKEEFARTSMDHPIKKIKPIPVPPTRSSITREDLFDSQMYEKLDQSDLEIHKKKKKIKLNLHGIEGLSNSSREKILNIELRLSPNQMSKKSKGSKTKRSSLHNKDSPGVKAKLLSITKGERSPRSRLSPQVNKNFETQKNVFENTLNPNVGSVNPDYGDYIRQINPTQTNMNFLSQFSLTGRSDSSNNMGVIGADTGVNKKWNERLDRLDGRGNITIKDGDQFLDGQDHSQQQGIKLPELNTNYPQLMQHPLTIDQSTTIGHTHLHNPTTLQNYPTQSYQNHPYAGYTASAGFNYLGTNPLATQTQYHNSPFFQGSPSNTESMSRQTQQNLARLMALQTIQPIYSPPVPKQQRMPEMEEQMQPREYERLPKPKKKRKGKKEKNLKTSKARYDDIYDPDSSDGIDDLLQQKPPAKKSPKRKSPPNQKKLMKNSMLMQEKSMKRSTSRNRLPFPMPTKHTLNNPSLVKKQNNYLQTIGKSPQKQQNRQRSEVTIREQIDPQMLHPDERRKRTQERLKADFLKKMQEKEKVERKGLLRNSLARRSTQQQRQELEDQIGLQQIEQKLLNYQYQQATSGQNSKLKNYNQDLMSPPSDQLILPNIQEQGRNTLQMVNQSVNGLYSNQRLVDDTQNGRYRSPQPNYANPHAPLMINLDPSQFKTIAQ